MSEQTYPLTYVVRRHDPPLTREQVVADPDAGACDALVLLSILYPPDGSYSVAPLSVDGRVVAGVTRGRGDQLSASEVWKAWTMLTHWLSNQETLSPNKRELCAVAFDCVATAVRPAK